MSEEKDKKKKEIIIIIFILIIFIQAIIIYIISRKFEIEFNTNGGNVIEKQEVKYNGKIVRPADPIKDGYVFDNWYYEDKIFDFNKKVKNKIVLSAKWKEVQKNEVFEIKFNDDEGKTLSVLKIKEGELINKPADPTKEGYKFISWQLNGEEFDFNTKVIEDITLVANFEKEENNQPTYTKPSTNPKPAPTPTPEVKITYSVVSTKVEGSAMEEYLYQIKGSDGKYYNGTIEFTLIEGEKITREISTNGIKYPSTLVKSVRYINVG